MACICIIYLHPYKDNGRDLSMADHISEGLCSYSTGQKANYPIFGGFRIHYRPENYHVMVYFVFL
jgi:hypothetical protein